MGKQGNSETVAASERQVVIPADGVLLDGTLRVPNRPVGLVVFAHGSGSSRFSSRNRFVAEVLNRSRMATLLLDLLSIDEGARDVKTAEYRFDIPRLAGRVIGALAWASRQSELQSLRLGLFGASTGAAAALIAAAEQPGRVRAVVSRGGRPDLAGDALEEVQAPCLLIVGARDTEVIVLNREAAARLGAEHQLVLIPDATHLFEEPGTLEEVAFLAADWFERHLGDRPLLPNGAPPRPRLVR